MTPLFDHIRFQARLRPGALAVWGPGGPVSYQELVRDVDGLATELLERGLTRQDIVGIEMGFSYLHALVILALDRLSIASTSFVSRNAVPTSPVDLARFGVTVIVSGEAPPAAPPCRWMTMPEQHRPRVAKPDAARLAALDAPADAMVRLMWSSGTTGGAKGSPVSRLVQHHRTTNRRLLRGFGPHTRYFTVMPLSSIPGYMRLIAVLASGGAVILPCPPIDFVSLANALGVTATGATPAMLTDLLGRGGARRLETVEYFELLGEHPSAKLVHDAERLLTPNLWVSYGSSEGDAVSLGHADVCLQEPTAVGFVMPWITVEVVDHADRVLPAGREGLLRVRGDQVIASYYRNDAATRRNFRDGWFYSGDLGALAEDGLLHVTGRVEDLIVRDGASVSPLPLEEALRGVPGVRDAAVFALDNTADAPDVCAALVLEPAADAAAVRRAAAAKLGDQAPARVFVIESLPRNSNGKVMRQRLAEMARRSVKA